MSARAYDTEIARALEPYARLKNGTKIVAGLADATERAARNWIQGHCGPHPRVLIRLMARDPNVAAAVQVLVEEQRRLDAEVAARRGRRGALGRGAS